MSEHNPFAAPSDSHDPASEQFANKDYGGIGRGAYFGLSVGAGIVNNVLQAVIIQADPGIGIVVGLILSLGITFALAFYRLKNLGYGGAWALGMIVPFLNILVGLRCLACPEGYADHKTLDTTAKVIIGIFFGAIALVIIAIALGSMA